MNISGFTYIRNGFTYGYPFIQSIKSLLPLVDEMIVVVGDSTDGTKEAVAAINSEKIRIIDTIWDDELRKSGKVFALQSNIGIEHITGDWGFHIQADEVLHEKDYEIIRQSIETADKRPDAEALLFPFYHFWGDYNHIRSSRKVHAYEIRAFKNTGVIRAYRDSQGFRKYASAEDYENGAAGQKLNVLEVGAPVYHYSYARHPYLMSKKAVYFHRFWHDDEWLKSIPQEDMFDFNDVDILEVFDGTHPQVMSEMITQQNWTFSYDPSRSNIKWKDKWLHRLNKLTGRRWFEFRNYIRIR